MNIERVGKVKDQTKVNSTAKLLKINILATLMSCSRTPKDSFPIKVHHQLRDSLALGTFSTLILIIKLELVALSILTEAAQVIRPI